GDPDPQRRPHRGRCGEGGRGHPRAPGPAPRRGPGPRGGHPWMAHPRATAKGGTRRMTERIDVDGLPSRTLVAGRDRAHARAMLRAVGLTDEDFEKPLIGIANTWAETTPCNYHRRELAEAVKVGVREAGGTPLEFNTVVVSDGISMGTEGMK